LKLLILVLLLVGCEDSKKVVEVGIPAHQAACVHSCVVRATWRFEEVSGNVIKDIREVCQAKWEHMACCEDKYGNYKECRRTR